MRFAVCYWHSFGWPGGDPFGGETFLRPWHHGSDPMALARAKADVAFELFRLLDVPFFTFHDADVAPEGRSLAESVANLNAIADLFERKMAAAKVRLLWGTANLFSHRRYMAGAATNPDPEVFAYAAGQVRAALEVTHRLGGQNYVLWGGREGYETLLNTDLKRELDQLGRFVSLVVEHKHKIGFKGTDPDRAQAEGADQAPVRFRRRHLLRLPAALRPARRRQAQHRAEPRHPRRPLVPARGRARRRRWASSARSTSTAATICSAGTPTSSR